MPISTYLIAGGAILGAGGLFWWAKRGGAPRPREVLEEYCLQFPQDETCTGTRARAADNARTSFAARQLARASWDLPGHPPADPGSADQVVRQVLVAYSVWAGPVGQPRAHSVGVKPALAQAPSWSNPNNPPANGLTARWNRLQDLKMGNAISIPTKVWSSARGIWLDATTRAPGPDTGKRVKGTLGVLDSSTHPGVFGSYDLPARTRALQDEGRNKWRSLGPGDREEAVLDWAAYWRTILPAAWQSPNSMPAVSTTYGTQVPAQVQYIQLSPPRYPPVDAFGGAYSMQPGGWTPSSGLDSFQDALDFPAWMAFWSPPPAAQQSIHETLAIAAETGPLRISSDPVVKKAVLTLPPKPAPASVSGLATSMANAMLDALCADHRLLDTVPAAQKEQWRQAMIARGCLSAPTAAGPRFMVGGTGMSPDDLDRLLGG